MKWKGDHKAKKDSMACKVEEEEALHKGKEPAWLDGEEAVNNKAVHLFDNNASPTCKAEEEEKEPIPAATLAAKPAPAKWIEFCTIRVMSMSSPSAHGSVCSMEIMIPI